MATAPALHASPPLHASPALHVPPALHASEARPDLLALALAGHDAPLPPTPGRDLAERFRQRARHHSARLRGLARGSLARGHTMARLIPGAARFARLDAGGLPATLGRVGSLEVRLARTVKEVRQAQRLRYRVFYEEMAARPAAAAFLARRDRDPFDAVCDHLLVIDHEAPRAPSRFAGGARFAGTPPRKPKPRVVGTYRMLRGEVAARTLGYYSAGEFDLAGVLAAHPGARVLELGRSCVLKPYRTKRTIELLWAGLWAYARHHGTDLMIGCASLEGTDPEALALPLSYLHGAARTPAAWAARPLPHRAVRMDRLGEVDERRALRALPPLVKAYLRVGARIGEGAVVDRQFGTTDVLIVLRVADIAPRYLAHYDQAPGAPLPAPALVAA